MKEFKVGDFIRTNEGLVAQITVYFYKEDSNDDLDAVQLSNGGFTTIDEIKHWEPQLDEWCWFWDYCTLNRANLRKFGKTIQNEYGEIFYEDNEQNPYTNCEPFINALPSIINDNK